MQRARLIAAMRAAVVSRGVARVTAGEVIARAGVSRRTFYEIFDGVEECLEVALEETLAAARERVLGAYDARAPWRQRIRAALLALLAFFEEEPVCAHMLLVDALAVGTAMHERRARVLANLAAAVDEGRQESARAARFSPLLAEGVVGGALEILAERVRAKQGSLIELCGPLMAMIVLPYLGPTAASRELERAVSLPARVSSGTAAALAVNPLDGLPMRLTYRTIRVLRAIASEPGASNRQIAGAAEIVDQGQISKLLARLQRLGLVSNEPLVAQGERGFANKWALTERGAAIERATHGAKGAGG